MTARLPADVCLISLNRAAKLRRVLVCHRPSDAVAHEPCGLVGDAKLALYLARADGLLRDAHALRHYEPRPQRNLAVLEDRALRHTELTPARLALVEGP